MDELCSMLTNCDIEYKPKLYDMMIYDFKDLSNQYFSNTQEYSFDMKPEDNYLKFEDINELCIYLQRTNVECIIKTRYPVCFIDKYVVICMIDYYIECMLSIF